MPRRPGGAPKGLASVVGRWVPETFQFRRQPWPPRKRESPCDSADLTPGAAGRRDRLRGVCSSLRLPSRLLSRSSSRALANARGASAIPARGVRRASHRAGGGSKALVAEAQQIQCQSPHGWARTLSGCRALPSGFVPPNSSMPRWRGLASAHPVTSPVNFAVDLDGEVRFSPVKLTECPRFLVPVNN
jgi:hypothetical protein